MPRDVKIAIHQPNFCPWFPFFYKMAMVDKFVILSEVQFEKNGWQNRCKVWDKWWTKPVHNGKEQIWKKDYIGLETHRDEYPYNQTKNGSLYEVNLHWIKAIKETLNIKTEIVEPNQYFRGHGTWDNPTEYLCHLVKNYGGNIYVTNPEAKNKYLDEGLVKKRGIKIEYCRVPRNLQRHTFEIFNEFGIIGAIKQLKRRGNGKNY